MSICQFLSCSLGHPWAIPGAGSTFSFCPTLVDSWSKVFLLFWFWRFLEKISFFLLINPYKFLEQGFLFYLCRFCIKVSLLPEKGVPSFVRTILVDLRRFFFPALLVNPPTPPPPGNSWCRVSFFLLVNPGQFLVQGVLFPSGHPL
jgi:hypothetical protein